MSEVFFGPPGIQRIFRYVELVENIIKPCLGDINNLIHLVGGSRYQNVFQARQYLNEKIIDL